MKQVLLSATPTQSRIKESKKALGEKRLGRPSNARGTREIILDAALRIVGREGLEGLTIGELAKSIGMSKSGLFAHFGGKDQLQLAVLELAMTRFVDLVMRPAFDKPRGEPRIRAMIANWLEHLNDISALPGGSILIAASTELDERPGPLRDFVEKSQKNLIANIRKAARMAVDEGHFRKTLDVDQFAWSLYSYVLGYYHFKRMLEDPKAELHLKHAFQTLMASAASGPNGTAGQRRDAKSKERTGRDTKRTQRMSASARRKKASKT